MPSRHPGPQARQRILDVALELFAAKGYAGTSVRDLAEGLGVTKAAITYHFAKKEDILRELVNRPGDSFDDVLRRHESRPVAVIDLFVEVLEVLVAQPVQFHALAMDPSVQQLCNLHDRAASQRRRLVQLIAGPEPEADDLLRARVAVGTLYGAALEAAPATEGPRLDRRQCELIARAAYAGLQRTTD